MANVSDNEQDLTAEMIKSDPAPDVERDAIFLDIDGTLLDIAARPQDVRVSDRLRNTLNCLAAAFDDAVAFVSGRSLADIDRLFHPLRLAAVGGHGAEIRPTASGETYHQVAPPLDPAMKELFANVGNLGPGVLVEDKGYSVALHYRLAPHLGGAVIKAVAEICARNGCDNLEILPGKSLIEIKARGFDKGSALREMMGCRPFAGRRPIFVGDDVTDEAAFAVLPEFSGIGCSVGGIVPGASFNFDGPHDVRTWLERILQPVAVTAR
jgi:trehalose 6-phosphate phosphatase